MSLPTFLGIGVPRAGTTWMASILDSHPEVYIAPGKEIFFFNRYYDRQLQWYETLFPREIEATSYKALGEFTPEYLYCRACPERIAQVPSITKLILSVRNPIDRLYSHYGLRVRSSNYNKPFESFLTPEMIDLGFYSRHITNYLRYFKREQLLILVFEQSIAKASAQTRAIIAGFLGLNIECFPSISGTADINRSYVPKAQVAFNIYARVMQLLLKWRQHRLVKLIRRLHPERLFGEAGPLPPMKYETRQYLRDRYKAEIKEMMSILQMDLSFWE